MEMITQIFSIDELHYLLEKKGMALSSKLNIPSLQKKGQWNEADVAAALIRGGSLVSDGEGYRFNSFVLAALPFFDTPEALVTLTETKDGARHVTHFLVRRHAWMQLILTEDTVALQGPMDEAVVQGALVADAPVRPSRKESYTFSFAQYGFLSYLFNNMKDGAIDATEITADTLKQNPDVALLLKEDGAVKLSALRDKLVEKNLLAVEDARISLTLQGAALKETISRGTMRSFARIDFNVEKNNSRELLFFQSGERVLHFQHGTEEILLRDIDRDYALMLTGATLLCPETLAKQFGAMTGNGAELKGYDAAPPEKAPVSKPVEAAPVLPEVASKEKEAAKAPQDEQKDSSLKMNTKKKKKMPLLLKLSLTLFIIAAFLLTLTLTMGPSVVAEYILAAEKTEPEPVYEFSQEIKKNTGQFVRAMKRFNVPVDDLYFLVDHTSYGDLIMILKNLENEGYRNRNEMMKILIDHSDQEGYNAAGFSRGFFYIVPPAHFKEGMTFLDEHKGPKLRLAFPFGKKLILEALRMEKEGK